MSNPLDIPEVVEKIFKHLDIAELVNMCHVNKLWRLEARRIICHNRSSIIYSFLKWPANHLRLSYGAITMGIGMRINSAIRKFAIFRKTFNLDAKQELLAIRDTLRKKHKKLHDRHKKLRRQINKCNYAMEGLAIDSDAYCRMNLLCWQRTVRADQAETQKFIAYRDLVDFESFLSELKEDILDKSEISAIRNKVQRLQNMEEERSWMEPANSIIEYWDGEEV